MQKLIPIAGEIAAILIARRETLAVSESSTGGLISAALLAVPGASAYFLVGAVVYTAASRHALLGIEPAAMAGIRPASEPYAQLTARTVRERHGATWACPRPALRGRPATATAMPRAIPALPRQGQRSGH
jgi:nicotinamide-nucleotide amidase